MAVRTRPLRTHEDEVERLVDELWLPFAHEMAGIDDYDAMVDEPDVREHGVRYRREQLDDEDARVWDAERGDEWLGYVRASVSPSPPVFTRGPTLQVGELYVVPVSRVEVVADVLIDRVPGGAPSATANGSDSR